jgi:NitT/TauT family transport system substrate-binding protein
MTRKRWRCRITALGLMALVAALLSACGSSSGSSSSSAGSSSSALVNVRMQLSWTPEAEFAGYLVAQANGYYKQAGLNVSILSGGPNVNDIQQLVTGAADVTVDRTSTLFQAWAKGVPIKAIAETDAAPQVELVAKKSAGITTPADLKGKEIGMYSDDTFIVDTMLKNMGLTTSEVHLFYQGFTPTGFIAGKYPVAEVYLSSDLPEILESGITLSQLTVFKPADYGAPIIHGSIIASDSFLQANPAAARKFVQATLRGWVYAYEHPYQAITIVLKDAGSSGGTRAYQTACLMEMKALQWPNGTEPANWGTIPVALYQQNANVVRASGVVNKPIDVAATIDTSIMGNG